MQLKEAKYYEKLENSKVKCLLCPHFCELSIDKIGICKTRINKQGALYTLAYSNPCAVNIDPIEKKPLFHFFPGTETLSIATAGCNLGCLNCQNSDISQSSPNELQTPKYEPQGIVNLALSKKIESISYTYTEPFVFFEYMYDIAKLAKSNNLKNIIVSAGYVNQEPLKEIIPFLDAANIDLKSFDDEIYKKVNKAKLKPVLETLKTLKESNVWLEITNLLIPGINDNNEMIENMCQWLVDNGFETTPLHFSRFHPHYKMNDLPATPYITIKNAIETALKKGLKYVYSGNVWNDEYEKTFCPNCGKILIDRQGFEVGNISIKNNKCKYCDYKVHGVFNN